MKINKKSILQQLYDCEFLPLEQIISRDPEYITASQKISQEREILSLELSSEGKKRLETLMDLKTQQSDMDGYANFSYGFRYGMLMMYEIINGEDYSHAPGS